MIRAVALLVALAVPVAACGGGGSGAAPSPTATATASAGQGGAPPRIGVILPDTTQARWQEVDRPAFVSAFKAARVPAEIRNAQGSPARLRAIADDLLAGGVTVLVIAGVDGDSARAAVAKATALGVPVVDLDRLTPGAASYYVGFDDQRVGRAIGEGLAKCLRDDGHRRGRVALLPGARGDPAAELAAQGAERALEHAGYRVLVARGGSGRGAFARVAARAHDRLVGVAAVDDALAGAAVSVLARQGRDGRVPVAGRGATDRGLQRVLLGTQCLTIAEPVAAQAPAAAALAVALAKGDRDAAAGQASGTVREPGSGTAVPAVILPSRLIYPRSVRDVVADGSTTALRLCTDVPLQAACQRYGVI